MGREPTERPDAPAHRHGSSADASSSDGTAIAEFPDANLGAMGLNPFRKQRVSTSDVVLVAGFVVLTLALVAWGFFG